MSKERKLNRAMYRTSYPAKIIKEATEEGEAWLVSFRDVPSAITYGKSKEHALLMAAECLSAALDELHNPRWQPPVPSTPRRGEILVSPEPRLALALAIRQERAALGITQTQLAKLLGRSQQQVAKWESSKGPAPGIRALRDLTRELGLKVSIQGGEVVVEAT